ncbi:uncharacterized protein LOC110398103 [Numida meleagris]|uniref:uncharacterized protein LOC110398103 n=1 Tax=Numida meleagris TaxID=8996 RepID=UPI000B3DE757|nr:uncharacterized protein LOC110398103 [Numida meleagris]
MGDGDLFWNNNIAKMLPPGTFLICDDRAWQGIPRNPVGGPCYLGKLTTLALSHRAWIQISRDLTHKGSLRNSSGMHTLDTDCSDEVKLWSATARIFASILAPGVAAAKALREIERLACWSIKQANATTEVLSDLLIDVNNIRHSLLQNRAAIDFLLLAQGHGCQDFKGMCCFNLSDHSESIHRKLEWMKKHTQKITVNDDPLGNWLRNLFGGLGPWIVQILKVVGVVLVMFICLAVCLPCLVACFQQCLSRMMEQAFDKRMEYYRLHECL